MTRVSLKEAYDNKDVVAQIYAIRDTAESAEDTADQAVTTANTASDHVDALVPQVEGAVQTANSASASAQASAQTVAGYENRLATAESDIDGLESDVAGVESDLNAVTLRVTTAEGDILTIQGRVTALETADGQNVKINHINDYAVGLTDNQVVYGVKTFAQKVNGVANAYLTESSGARTAGTYQVVVKIPKTEIYTAGIRGHILFAIGIRGGAGGFDVLDVSTNVRAPTGIKMGWGRGLNHNVTYIVSDDTDYIYLSRINLGNSNDGVIGLVLNSWGVNFVANITPNNLITDTERASAEIAGTEIGRVNNI